MASTSTPSAAAEQIHFFDKKHFKCSAVVWVMCKSFNLDEDLRIGLADKSEVKVKIKDGNLEAVVAFLNGYGFDATKTKVLTGLLAQVKKAFAAELQLQQEDIDRNIKRQIKRSA